MNEFEKFISKRTFEITKEINFKKAIFTHLKPHLLSLKSSNNIRQKEKELNDLVKFIYYMGKSIEIIDVTTECPDFIIKVDGELVGIELTDVILNDKEKQKEGLLQKIFTQIELELQHDEESYRGIYRVDFRENITFNLEEQRQIKQEIKDFIQGKIYQYSLIESVEKIVNSNLHIYHSEPFTAGNLKRVNVEKAINKKEKKLLNYRKNELSCIYLLLRLGGLSASDSYCFVEEDIINIPFPTNFQKIYLLDMYKSKIWELKTQIP